MAVQLDAEMESDFERVLCAAGSMLESVKHVHMCSGEIPSHMLSGIEALQDDMIRLLALCEDGELYGKVPQHVTYTMRGYEADATEILEFHGKLSS